VNFRKVRAIIRREYVEHIRRKAFWIFTVLMPIIWIGFIGASLLTQSRMTSEKTVAVVDVTGRYFSSLQAEVGAARGGNRVRLVRRAPGPGGLAALKAELTREVNRPEKERRIDAFVVLDDAAIAKGSVAYWAPSISDIMFQQTLELDLNKAIQRARLEARGVAPDVIRESQQTVSLDPRSTQPGSTVGFWISYIFMFFLFFTLIQYGMYNLRGVIEEKSSRIVEIVISSVRPIELMLGKILGIGLVGLTQYAIWGVLAMNLALLSGAGLALMGLKDAPTIPFSTVAYFVLFFVLGYFFYASVYTAIGAPFNSDQEAQQLAMFPTWILAVPMFFWWIIVNSPNGTLATTLSFIPFMTPVVMFMRVTLAPVPAWQVLASVLIMVGSIVAMAWFAGKIYRVGILMYGKKPTIPEILRWARRPAAAAAGARGA
jgi:ABC-2 type transport system permease protein